MTLTDVFAAAMDADNQIDAALCILAHPGSPHMQRATLDVLSSVVVHGLVLAPRDLDAMWALAECWGVLHAADC